MKTILQKTLVVCWLSILSFQASANDVVPSKSNLGDCEANCFTTEILSAEAAGEGCIAYQLKVSTTGDCAHALSHYTVEVPTCFDITQVSNSQNWKQEVAATDPTSGIYGFKIDDIEDFGEDEPGESFIVDFTVCTTESCDTELSCWAPTVAYKASTCVYYEETEISCVSLSAHLEQEDVNCNGAATGSVSVIIDEGNGPFTYAWSNGADTETISNLSAGSYSVIITDAASNTLELETVIEEPAPIEISAEATNASCSGKQDGAIDVSVSGGTGSYTYSWSTGADTEDIEGIASGSYIVSVTDENGCTVNERFTVANDINITLTANITKSSCSADDGAIDLTVSGGTSPYTYSWDNGASTEDLNDLAAGLYKVAVTDANGCSANGTFLVQEDNPLSITATTTKTGCVEDNTGSIDITVSGGAEPYEYSWSNGETTEDIDGLAADRYTVNVTDQNGCSRSLSVMVSSQSFDVSPSITPVNCAGEADGAITLTSSGGVEPYTYAWSNGATGATIDGLSSGLYNATITDASGCTKEVSYFVTEPAALAASASVSNVNCEPGAYSIGLNVSGGSGSYTFEWSNGATTQNISDLEVGEYSVVITDTNGCTMTLTVVVDATSAGCDDGTGDDGSGDDGDGDDGSGDDGDGDDGDGDDGDGGDGDGDGDDDGDGDGGDDDGGDDGDGDDGNDDGSGGNGSGGIDKNCDNPYNSEIQLIEVSEGCYTYMLTINYSGEHSYGLSHLSVEQLCGDLTDVDVEYNWPVEEGTDPTTGITGFKIDEISGFGEGSLSDSFETTFTICTTDESCAATLESADFTIAYKYGQCVSTEDVEGEANITSGLKVYPNPFRSDATIEFTSLVDTEASVEIYNQRGLKVETLYHGIIKANETNRFIFTANGLPNDIYTYKISTQGQVYHGKIVKY